jgi:urea carboxylase
MREDFPRGRCRIEIEETTFSLARYNHFVAEHREDIATFKARQQAAFDAERRRWAAAGQADTAPVDASPDETAALALADGEIAIESHVHGVVWQLSATEGEHVQAGQTLLVLEFMKTELTITAATAGRVTRVLCREGAQVAAGQALLVIASR